MATWIPQQSGKKNCGVIAVAVLTGVPVTVAAVHIGKNGATTTKQLAKGLRALGYQCPNRLVKFKLPLPPMAIAKMVSPSRKSGWHWVAISEGKIYDGIFGTPDGKVNWPTGAKMTSYLPVTKIDNF
jgi:hypothetical protein